MMLFSVLGVTDGVIGPTLLDLKDFIGVTIGQISFILMMSSIGSMVGCFLTGFLLDKFNQFQYLILTGWLNIELISIHMKIILYYIFKHKTQAFYNACPPAHCLISQAFDYA